MTVLASAQKFEPGYFVKSSGDTVKTNIFLRKKKGYILGVLTEAGERIKPSGLRAVNINRINYVIGVVSIDKSPKGPVITDTAFLEVMSRGRMSLLYMLDDFDKNHFYIEDETGDREELAQKIFDKGDGITFQTLDTYKQTLKVIFPDCKELFPLIEKTRYTKNSMRSTFDELHQCKYSVAPRMEVHKDVVTDIGVTTGITSSDVEYQQRDGGTAIAPQLMFDKSVDLVIGFFAVTHFSKTGDLFSIRNEITHRQYSTSSGDLYNGKGGTAVFGNVSASYLKYSFLVRQDLSRHKLKPFINIGVSPSLLLSQTNKVTYAFTNGPPQRSESMLGKTKNWEFGFFGGGGLAYESLSLELRVERSNGLQPEYCNSSVNTLYIMFSYRLFEGNR